MVVVLCGGGSVVRWISGGGLLATTFLWMKCLQVPREALEIAGTSINFRSGKFGYSICPFFSKGYAEFFREFWHDFAKNRTYSCVA